MHLGPRRCQQPSLLLFPITTITLNGDAANDYTLCEVVECGVAEALALAASGTGLFTIYLPITPAPVACHASVYADTFVLAVSTGQLISAFE